MNTNFEVRKLTIEDMELLMPCFQNENDGYATLGKSANYAQFMVEGIKNPVYYMRNINPESQRWAGMIELGDTPLSIQKKLPNSELAQAEAKTHAYQKVSDCPITYEIRSENPHSLLRFIDDGQGGFIGEYQEGENGCILDLKIEPFPVAVISHANENQPTPYFQVNTIIQGTYMGRPIEGMGGLDRTYVAQSLIENEATMESKYAATYQCTCALYSGIREDGRKECVYALLSNENGKGIGMYYLEGEKTIVTDQVYLEAEFEALPYVEDGTLVYTKATWKIGPKTIHFTGEWGTKGFTAEPKYDKHGQSQCFGTWYEGDIPYQHRISHGFNENTGDAYAERFKKMGFKIK